MWAELDLEARAAKKDAGAGVRSAEEIEQIVVMVRLELYNRGLACGPKALRRRLGEHYAFTPLPSQRTILPASFHAVDLQTGAPDFMTAKIQAFGDRALPGR